MFLDDSKVLDFPAEVTREHSVLVAQELVHGVTSTGLVPL